MRLFAASRGTCYGLFAGGGATNYACFMRFKRQSRFIAILLVTTAAACSSGGQGSGDERFVAIELKGEDDQLLEGNVTLFTIEGNEIVPTFRLGPSNDVGSIKVRNDFGSDDDESYFGFPEFVGGGAVFVNRGNDADQLLLIDTSSGEKSRLLSSEARFRDITFFKKRGILVANSGYGDEGRCYVVDKSLEVRRVGSGNCVATDGRLWLISIEDDETRISEIDDMFEVAGRRTIQSSGVLLSSSGRLAIATTTRGLLEIYSMASGDVLWSSKESDSGAQILATATYSDSFLVGIDADDSDGEVEVLWMRLKDGTLKSDSLGSSRTAFATLSRSGEVAIVGWEDPDSVTRYDLVSLEDSGTPRVQDLGNAESAWFIEPNIIATVEDDTLYVTNTRSTPRRAMDIYGRISSIVSTGGASLLVTTSEDDKTTLSLVSPDGERWKSSEAISGVSDLSFADTRGSSALVVTSEDEGYGSLYEVSVTDGGRTSRIAEGNILRAAFGAEGLVYFAEVNGSSVDVYHAKPGDRKSRTRVSSRYIVRRFGPSDSRYATSARSREMTAVIDPLLAYCRSSGIPILDVSSPSNTVAVKRDDRGTSVGCVRMRQQGSEVVLNVSVESNEDLAIEWLEYSLSEDQTPANGGQVSRLLSADDSGSSLNPSLRVTSSAASALIRLYSWGEDATGTISIGSATSSTSSTEFDRDRYEADERAREACRIHAVVEAGEIKRIKVGVLPSGFTGVTPFCVRLDPSLNSPRNLVMNPIEIGDVAALTVACTDDQFFFRRDFQSDRPSIEDYDDGYRFSTSLKGLIGLCEFQHYWNYPANNRWGTWGEVDISLQR